MDNDCGCSSRARGVSKAPILTGDYNISWNHILSASSCRKCTQGKKTDFSSSAKQSKSSTASEAPYFPFKKSDHYYGDLDSTHVPLSFLYHKSPYLYKKRTSLAEAAVPVPHRTSSLAFRSSSKNLKKMGSVQELLPASPEASGSPGFSSSLSFGTKHLEHVQKVLEDIRTWHKEVSISIARSHPRNAKDCHQNNVNNIPSQDSHDHRTRYLESTSMNTLQQNASWARVFNGDNTTSRRYTSSSLCPGSNEISSTWRTDPIPSSIYKPKPIHSIGTRQNPRPIPSPRTSSLGATMGPRRRNAVRGRILPHPVSIICSTLKQHSHQAQFTGSSPGDLVLDDYSGDRESALISKEENTKTETIHFPAVIFTQSKLPIDSPDHPCEHPESHKNGLPYSGTVIRLSARHSSLQSSEPTFETLPFQNDEEEEKSRHHIAFVHSALRNLVPFEVSDYLYRVSQSPEASDYPGEAFLDDFAVTTSPYIKSNSGYQSSETLGQDECCNPGDKLSPKRVSNGRPPTQPVDIVNTTKTSTVQKIVTEILPASSGLAFGKDARDLLIECCVEFITLISSEANEISEKESKKTIACEHITKALEQLGFGEYVKDIVEVASEHKEQLKGREKKANKLEQSGLTPEQLLAMQEEAFRDAAQRHG
ncbi:hypothetical protein SBOR_8889 [Sclerotinia borealis F-4128]|uniref:NCT transcriptional regulatory complex subunit B n=1 Tax=Sclerotinia borealis (strain F-4128) TaxID=1432307 RepID=W9C765_SCLBF|nr:hypothetical protein SBOR_8889 [Sclerotinia borealis F-4128]